jgi:hypothetical protein
VHLANINAHGELNEELEMLGLEPLLDNLLRETPQL